MQDVYLTIQMNVSPEEVFAAITDPPSMAGWWTTHVTQDDAGEVTFHFVDERFQPRMTITQKEASSRVEWTFTGGHEWWTGGVSRFELKAAHGGTELFFHHHYAQDLAPEAFGRLNYGWAYFLDSLRMLCEEGTGRPFQATGQPAG